MTITKQGFVLFELILVLGLLSLLVSSVFLFGFTTFKNFENKKSQQLTYLYLHLMRSRSIASNANSTIRPTPKGLLTMFDPIQENFFNTLDINTETAINHLGKLGFNHLGNTRYSGTLTLLPSQKKISLSAGYGKPSLK